MGRHHQGRTISTALLQVVCFAIVQLLLGVPVQAAQLLRDINPAAEPLGSMQFVSSDRVTLGGITFFAMDDGKHGLELWRTDGTPAGTTLVKDIHPGETGSDLTAFTELNGRVVFMAKDGINGLELWSTDGTNTGTQIIADLDASPNGSVSIPSGRSIPKLGNAIVFAAQDAATGLELWRSDGTQSGTWRIRDINPGNLSSDPREITVVGALAFFTATSAANGTELWVTDGSPNGTRMVRDIALNQSGAASSHPAELTVTNSGLYFRADDGIAGPELWVADLAGNGATLVNDFVPGPVGSNPRGLAALGDLVIYTASEPGSAPNQSRINTGELYRSNGTASGTSRLRDINPGDLGSSPEILARVGNRLIFQVNNPPVGDIYFWSTDGTSAGTAPLSNIPGFNFYNWRKFYPFKQELLFFVRPGYPGANGSEPALWRTDGTASGTRVFADLPQPANPPDELAVLGDRVYYPAGTCCDPGSDDLWSSNGTPAGTARFIDFTYTAGSPPQSLYSTGSLLYFMADDGVHGLEPWVSDGTVAGTKLLGDFNKLVVGTGNTTYIATLGSNALLVAGDGIHGDELWVTDGTTNGTRLLRDINVGAASSRITLPITVGSIIYFQADDGVTGQELWRTDGTTAGTYLVADIFPGAMPPPVCAPRAYCPPPDPNPPPASSAPMDGGAVYANNILYFIADDGVHGRELWRSNGTAAGTYLFKELQPNSPYSAMFFLAATNNRFFMCVGEVDASRLWVSDGTAQGTVKVTDGVDCGAGGPMQATALQGVVYFPARVTIDNDVELWRSDGTAAGTYRVMDLNPGGNPAYLSGLAAIGNSLAFGGCDNGQSGCGFFLSNGTAAGTIKVPGIPQPYGPPRLLNGRLYYFGSIGGRDQLYSTDGTVAGTTLALPTNKFTAGPYPTNVIDYMGKLVFTADDGIAGPATWISDGSASGTRMLFGPQLGGVKVTARDYFVLGNSLYATANDTTHGDEPWLISSGAPIANDDLATVAASSSVNVGVLQNDGFVATALNQSSVAIVLQPLHGATMIDSSTGAISYRPASGFSGADELTYQVADVANRTSNIATVNVLVTPPVGGAPGTAPVTPTPPIPTPTPMPTPAENSKSGGGGSMSLVLLAMLFALLKLNLRAKFSVANTKALFASATAAN